MSLYTWKSCAVQDRRCILATSVTGHAAWMPLLWLLLACRGTWFAVGLMYGRQLSLRVTSKSSGLKRTNPTYALPQTRNPPASRCNMASHYRILVWKACLKNVAMKGCIKYHHGTDATVATPAAHMSRPHSAARVLPDTKRGNHSKHQNV